MKKKINEDQLGFNLELNGPFAGLPWGIRIGRATAEDLIGYELERAFLGEEITPTLHIHATLRARGLMNVLRERYQLIEPDLQPYVCPDPCDAEQFNVMWRAPAVL